jgi:hypothetical protein
MSLPPTVHVKISSEATEMSVTPVVSREMSADELVLRILGVTGKDAHRVCDILQRGSILAGASRIRWSGVATNKLDVREFLVRFPDPDPLRPFDAGRCVEIVLAEGLRRVSIEVETARKRRWFQRASFWDVLLQAIPHPAYHDYSYKDSADVYRTILTAQQRSAIQGGLRLLTFPVRLPAVDAIDLYVPRV